MMEEKSNSYKIGVQHLQLYEYSVVLRLRSFDEEFSTSRKKKKKRVLRKTSHFLTLKMSNPMA